MGVSFRKSLLIIAACLSLVGYLVVCCMFQSISPWYAFSLLGYEIFSVFAVGYALLKILRLSWRDSAITMAYAYGTGYAVSIVLYLLVFPIYGENGLRIAVFGITILAIVFLAAAEAYRLIRKRNANLTRSPGYSGFAIVACFAGMLLLLQFFISAVGNMSPALLGRNSFYRDILYWSADAVGLKQQFPPTDFRTGSEMRYYYHYFSSIHIASISIVTGIKISSLVFGFAFVPSSIFLALSVYTLFRTVVKRTKYVVIAMFAVFFCTGYESFCYITHSAHLLTYPFGYDVGLAVGMLIIALLYRQYHEKKINMGIYICCMLLFFVCCGIKSPIAAMTLGMSGLVCIAWLVAKQRRNVAAAFLYGGTLLAVFAALYLLIVNGPLTGGSKTEFFLEHSRSIFSNPQIEAIKSACVAILGNYLGKMIFLGIYLIFANPIIFLLAGFSAIWALTHREAVEEFDVILIIAVLVGTAITARIRMLGLSQMYFMMCMLPYALCFALNILSKQEKNAKCIDMRKTAFSYCIIGMLLVWGTVCFINSNYIRPQFTSGLLKAMKWADLTERDDIYVDLNGDGKMVCREINPEEINVTFLPVSAQQLEACEWLRENTEKTAVIASRVVNASYDRQYCLGVFAERSVFYDGEGLLVELEQGDAAVIEKLADKNVGYLLINNSVLNELQGKLDHTRIVYCNDEVSVLKLEV